MSYNSNYSIRVSKKKQNNIFSEKSVSDKHDYLSPTSTICSCCQNDNVSSFGGWQMVRFPPRSRGSDTRDSNDGTTVGTLQFDNRSKFGIHPLNLPGIGTYGWLNLTWIVHLMIESASTLLFWVCLSTFSFSASGYIMHRVVSLILLSLNLWSSWLLRSFSFFDFFIHSFSLIDQLLPV